MTTTTRRWIASLLAAVLLSGMAAPAAGSATGNAAGNTVDDAVGSVAVLVLDEFDPVPAHVSGPAEQNCAYTGQHANVVGSTGAGDGMPPGLAHGSVVFDRVRAELSSTPYLVHLTTAPPPIAHPWVIASYVDAWQYRSSRVLLVGVDAGGFDSTTLTTNLNAIAQILRTQQGITRFVVNMSFVFAPCDVRAWLEKNGIALNAETLLTLYRGFLATVPALTGLRTSLDTVVATTPADGLVTALLTDPSLTPLADRVPVNMFYAQLAGLTFGDIDPLANTPAGRAWRQINNDPMRRYLTEQTAGRMISVAAAGNGSFVVRGNVVRHMPLTIPFAPALWNEVVSVSASRFNVLALYSNSGEVMLDGETPQNVRGTSFAAPRLSAGQAVYLLAGGPLPCGAAIPPLGYTNSSRSDSPLWSNLSIVDAAARSCHDFLSWTTSP